MSGCCTSSCCVGGPPARPALSWSTRTTPTRDALARELGLADRVTRLHADIAADPDVVGRHDIVVMHRVVCCYPDAERLLSVAADHAGRVLVFSHPPRNLLSRALIGAENLARRARRLTFRVYVHDPAAMFGAARDGGRLRQQITHRGLAWHIAAFTADPTAVPG